MSKKTLRKRGIEALVTSLTDMSGDESIQGEGGTLDMAKFRSHQRVQDVCAGLRALGLKDREELRREGFLAAAMILPL